MKKFNFQTFLSTKCTTIALSDSTVLDPSPQKKQIVKNWTIYIIATSFNET